MSTETIVAICGACGAVVGLLIKVAPPVRRIWTWVQSKSRKIDESAQKREMLRESLRENRRIAVSESLLKQWMPRKGYQRGLVLLANNSGKEWRTGGTRFVSNPAQVVGQGEPKTSDMWVNWECDAWYRKFLGDLLEAYDRKTGILVVREHDVEGEIYSQYAAQGTVASVVLPYYWTAAGALWYVSLNFGRYEGENRERPMSQEEIDDHVEAARMIARDKPRMRMLIDALHSAYCSVR